MYYIGLDCSTQSLTACVIAVAAGESTIIAHVSVNFQEQFGQEFGELSFADDAKFGLGVIDAQGGKFKLDIEKFSVENVQAAVSRGWSALQFCGVPDLLASLASWQQLSDEPSTRSQIN